jgi:hypothetical protein
MSRKTKRQLIEGKPALIVIDIQAGTFIDTSLEDRYIPHMDDYVDRMLKARGAIDKARACNIPLFLSRKYIALISLILVASLTVAKIYIVSRAIRIPK